jgi:hypothetical protein
MCKAYTITCNFFDGRWVVYLHEHDSLAEAIEKQPNGNVWSERREAIRQAHRKWKAKRELGDELNTPWGTIIYGMGN